MTSNVFNTQGYVPNLGLNHITIGTPSSVTFTNYPDVQMVIKQLWSTPFGQTQAVRWMMEAENLLPLSSSGERTLLF